MMHLAFIISGGSIKIPKGLINACISRCTHLKQNTDYQIDVYDVQLKKVNVNKRFFLGKDRLDKTVSLGGFSIKVIWGIEYYSNIPVLKDLLKLYYKFFKSKYRDLSWLNRVSKPFAKYDMLCANSTEAAYLAYTVKQRFGVPFSVTWHGSDIHTIPFNNPVLRDLTVSLIESADVNFFVSDALLRKSGELTPCGKKTVLYNGVSDAFKERSLCEKRELRRQFNVNEGCKVVSFVGNLRDIKNVLTLPSIFERIKTSYDGEVVFWFVGDGVLRERLQAETSRRGLNCVFWGNQPGAVMPDMYNCIDILLLPSLNEGLPLVLLEAMKCGANVLASNVGGIPEVIGEVFCFDLDDDFVEKMAAKSIELLHEPVKQTCKDCFDWDSSARKEAKCYKEILGL